jgi:hypothetical protein
MLGDKDQPTGERTAKQAARAERVRRLAEALRVNLRKRKEAARMAERRRQPGPPEGGGKAP